MKKKIIYFSIYIILLLNLISVCMAEEDTLILNYVDGEEDKLTHINLDELKVSVSGDSFSDIREAVENAKDGDTITLSGTYNSDKKNY